MKNLAKSKINSDLKYVYSENNALSIVFQSNELLLGVLGEFNNNLKELEKITNTSIYSRGNSILLKNTPEKNELIKKHEEECWPSKLLLNYFVLFELHKQSKRMELLNL